MIAKAFNSVEVNEHSQHANPRVMIGLVSREIAIAAHPIEDGTHSCLVCARCIAQRIKASEVVFAMTGSCRMTKLSAENAWMGEVDAPPRIDVVTHALEALKRVDIA